MPSSLVHSRPQCSSKSAAGLFAWAAGMLLGRKAVAHAISWRRRRENRADIPMPEVISGANSWESGQSVQMRLEEVTLKRR